MACKYWGHIQRCYEISSQEHGPDGGTQAAADKLQLLCFGATKFFDLDWQLSGCLSSCHPSTILCWGPSPDLLMMDTVVYSWAHLSPMMCSWHKERNCRKGANACWIPTPMQSMGPSSVLQGDPVWMQFDAWVRYSNTCSANPTKACIDAGWDKNHNTDFARRW